MPTKSTAIRNQVHDNVKLKTQQELHRRGTMPDAPPLWEQLPHENDRQYATFKQFRDIGPSRVVHRFSIAVGQREGEDRYNPQTVTVMSQKYAWIARAQAWDVAQEQIQRELEQEDATLRGEAQPNWRARAQISRNEDYVDAHDIDKIVRDRLDLHFGRVRDKHGRVVPDQKIEPVPIMLDAKTLPQWKRLASSLRNEAIANQPKKLTGVAGDDDMEDLQDMVRDLKELTTDQLKRVAAQAKKGQPQPSPSRVHVTSVSEARN